MSEVKTRTAKPWNESRVFDSLRHVFPSPAYVRIPSVRNGTGYSRRQTRTADAVVFSVWPSRGLWMAGVEIKVSRSDWKKELASPEKSAEIQQYCNYWYVAAPSGVVPVNEVPETWGLIQVEGNTAEITKAATRLDAKSPDLSLVCAIFRAVEGAVTPTAIVEKLVNDARIEAAKSADVPSKYELDNLKEAVAEFEKSSGVYIRNRWDSGRIGRIVKFVRSLGGDNVLSRLRNDANLAKKAAEKLLVDLDTVGQAGLDVDFDREENEERT